MGTWRQTNNVGTHTGKSARTGALQTLASFTSPICSEAMQHVAPLRGLPLQKQTPDLTATSQLVPASGPTFASAGTSFMRRTYAGICKCW
jgi:hypothetical protein